MVIPYGHDPSHSFGLPLASIPGENCQAWCHREELPLAFKRQGPVTGYVEVFPSSAHKNLLKTLGISHFIPFQYMSSYFKAARFAIQHPTLENSE